MIGLALYAGLILARRGRLLAAVGAAGRDGALAVRARGARRRRGGRRARGRLLLGLTRVGSRGARRDHRGGRVRRGPARGGARGRAALEASLAVTDAWGATLAVAARSPAEERALLSQGRGREQLAAARRRHGRRDAAHARQDRAERLDAAAAADDDRLGGRARARARARLGDGRRATSCARCCAAS